MLLVELGNTRIKSTLCGESGIGDVFQITHSSPTWQKDFKSYLASLAQPVRVCYIASVASVALTASLEQLVTRNLALQPVEIKAQKDFLGVINGYQAVETLGVDRWLAMIAAYQRFLQG
ncbi:MAG: type III pantothenate kinase, partial [Gammaproteobacteria bacterium]|nr:type III pantothenate kinase [Gammaproteobacteria bacterium]